MTAFDYADYLLYIYALIAYSQTILWSPGVWALPDDLAFLFLTLVSAVFFYILMRNYLVMRAIDHHNLDSKGSFAFVSLHFGVLAFFERVFRLLIIAVVIVTPKEGYLKFFSGLITWVATWMKGCLAPTTAYKTNIISDPYARELLHDSIPYYGAVVFLLFALFLLWDIVNVVAAKLHLRAGRMIPHLSEDNLRLNDRAYRSLLCYMNICKPDHEFEERVDAVQIRNSRRVRVAASRAKIANGGVLALYPSSPKFWERICGMLVGWAMVYAGQNELASLPEFFLMLSIGAYGLFVSKNERPLSAFKEFVLLLVSYFVQMRWTPSVVQPVLVKREIPKAGTEA